MFNTNAQAAPTQTRHPFGIEDWEALWKDAVGAESTNPRFWGTYDSWLDLLTELVAWMVEAASHIEQHGFTDLRRNDIKGLHECFSQVDNTFWALWHRAYSSNTRATDGQEHSIRQAHQQLSEATADLAALTKETESGPGNPRNIMIAASLRDRAKAVAAAFGLPEPTPPARTNTQGIALDKEDILILKKLQEKPARLYTLDDLEAVVARHTAHKHVKQLMTLGFVARPKGNKGCQITPDGQKALSGAAE